ncbi:winged helix-turn-helix domain-containing protein [Allosphingosinicella vermicomposti]|uniref:winged helix-turn-helix domain-containing protein n=1 Tax=Allosphingosinicella vermicomposti TaxID=614671 RepID=UPI000D0E7821|nr:winged helix-turn-helix domain-containing protein [Allosphingosinicella vermicomposti]
MTSGGFHFDRFQLDPDNRRLLHDGQPVDLNGRYFDALVLLVGEQGKLVSKERFLADVWRGVPVTDEALTQCVRTLRRQLGDDAARPRFIETVPKHGYRFIASVGPADEGSSVQTEAPLSPSKSILPLGLAGTIGGGCAGVVGGVLYGLIAAQSLQPAMGALSILLVLTAVTGLVGLAGGAGVGFGIAVASARQQRTWFGDAIGGAAGGLFVGALVNLVGLDAFSLLLGQAPVGITGAREGGILGAVIGLAFGMTIRKDLSLRRSAAIAAAMGAAAGLLISLLGGQLLGGSLALLTESFPGSRLRLEGMGSFFGETGFGPIARAASAALEAALFSSCLVTAMMAAWRKRLF